MVGCDIIILYDGKPTFSMTSLYDMLEKQGLDVRKNDFKMSELSAIKMYPRFFIIDAEVINAKSKEKTYLCDMCIEKDLRLVIMGEPIQVDQVMEKISPKIVAATFKRPINTAEMVKALGTTLEYLKFEDQKKKIMVVDDSPMFLRTISEWLDNDYQVNVCPSATAAFHMIEINRPDLILLDYEMPICSGAQFLEMLHSEPTSADIPVIFLTSRSDKETVNKVIALKPQGYLLKTLPKEQILNTLTQFFLKEKGI